MCVCVCVCARPCETLATHTHTYTHTDRQGWSAEEEIQAMNKQHLQANKKHIHTCATHTVRNIRELEEKRGTA